MTDRPLRVVVASEHAEFRHMLAGIAEHEPGIVVVGTAENSLKALALVRHLRPEIALVDSNLPYLAGADSIRLSRMSGLDTAVCISNENPSVTTILISDPRQEDQAPETSAGEPALWVYGESGSSHISVRLRDLTGGVQVSPGPAFGGISFSERRSDTFRLTRFADKTVMSGGLAVMGGLGLMATIMFAGAGIVLAAAGACVIALGLLGKLGASWWHRRR